MKEETEQTFHAFIKIFLTFVTGVLSGFGGFYIASVIAGFGINYALFYAIASTTLISSTIIMWAADSHDKHYGDTSSNDNSL